MLMLIKKYKKELVAMGVLLVILLFVSISYNCTGNVSRETYDTQNSITLVEPETLTTEVFNDIYIDYQRNEVRAEAQYEGKTFYIVGIVNEIHDRKIELYYSKNDIDNYEFYTINCLFNNNDKIKTLNINDEVAIIGNLQYIIGFGLHFAENRFDNCYITELQNILKK